LALSPSRESAPRCGTTPLPLGLRVQATGAYGKPKAKRLVIRALTGQGCIKLSDEDEHEKLGCPLDCGQRTTSVHRHNEITAGVVGGIIADLKCLPKGWV